MRLKNILIIEVDDLIMTKIAKQQEDRVRTAQRELGQSPAGSTSDYAHKCNIEYLAKLCGKFDEVRFMSSTSYKESDALKEIVVKLKSELRNEVGKLVEGWVSKKSLPLYRILPFHLEEIEKQREQLNSVDVSFSEPGLQMPYFVQSAICFV